MVKILILVLVTIIVSVNGFPSGCEEKSKEYEEREDGNFFVTITVCCTDQEGNEQCNRMSVLEPRKTCRKTETLNSRNKCVPKSQALKGSSNVDYDFD